MTPVNLRSSFAVADEMIQSGSTFRGALSPSDIVLLGVGFQLLQELSHLVFVDLVAEPAALSER
jgi:hypothetical protein